MTNIKRKRRARYEINCSEEELKMINDLSKLTHKKRSRILIELVQDKLEELKENK